MPTPLDLLIAAAREQVAAKGAAKKAEASAKNGKTAAQREASLIESQRLQRELDWLPRALVLVIEEWECACEHIGETPLGMFVYKEHARMTNSSILVAPRHEADAGNTLPRKIKYTQRIVPICGYCSTTAGFSEELIDNRVKFQSSVAPTPGPFVQDWLDKRVLVPEDDTAPTETNEPEEDENDSDDNG